MISKLLLKIPSLRRISPLLQFELNRRMDPSFFIVGFQKSGTTSLYDMLMQHPDVSKGLMKENNILAEKADRLNEFRLCFPLKEKGKTTGDASHLHTWMPGGLERIKNFYPNAKLIVIMRDPVGRAYSHFNMDQKIGYVPQNLSFEQYIDIENILRKSIEDGTNPDETYNKTKLYGNRYGWALSRGIYANYIEKIQNLEMDFLPMFMEDLATDYEGQSRRVQYFLGLNYSNLPQKVTNRGKYQSKLNQDTERRLKAFYKPHDDRLESLLNCSLAWR